eukprot:TRINITY_DN6659_c0_g1_i4.p1 TRINITY_DN6659_c0_g1~~TRINITY_DN6659_c0_g1_i4.p1  ORF type:complete len:421 (+),score=57.62 TRINITY_DN6659_c0_g1_i4:28-1263(+)
MSEGLVVFSVATITLELLRRIRPQRPRTTALRTTRSRYSHDVAEAVSAGACAIWSRRDGEPVSPSESRLMLVNLLPPGFKAHATEAFASLRSRAYRVSDSELRKSLRLQPLQRSANMEEAGKSGSLFFVSHDGRVIFKTLRGNEHAVLLDLLPELLQHHSAHPGSLLPHFLGLFSLQIELTNDDASADSDENVSPETLYIVAMENLLFRRGSFCDVDALFDLKGSTAGRTSAGRIQNDAPRGSSTAAQLPHTLKDLDLREVFELREPDRQSLLRQVAHDAALLARHCLMDYSVLVGVSHRAQMKPHRSDAEHVLGPRFARNRHKKLVELAPLPPVPESGLVCESYIGETRRPVVLYVGFVDVLQKYTLRKQLETAIKSLLSTEASSVAPNVYMRRLLKFLSGRVFRQERRQ